MAATGAGPAGSPLVIDLLRKREGIKRISVIRTKAFGGVGKINAGLFSIVRIPAFTPGTRQELEFAVAHASAAGPIVIDLRGNRGGDLHAAIDCAMLFLHRGEIVATVRGRKGTRSYSSSIEGRSPAAPVYLWQDEGTASAAEAFIGALRDNGRAISIGRKSFGKGSEQRMVQLDSGATLLLTTGDLLTPRGDEIEGRGLEPDDVVPQSARTSDYVGEVIRLFRTHPVRGPSVAAPSMRVAG